MTISGDNDDDVFVTALDRLQAAAGNPTAANISHWIERNHGRAIAAKTIQGWTGENGAPRRIPRVGQGFEFVLEYLLELLGTSYDLKAAQAEWERRRQAAQRARKRRTSTATKSPNAPRRLRQPTALVAGAVPREPPHYVMRTEVGQLEENLAGGQVATVLTGMRGAGKTQIAAAHARHVLDIRHEMVGWVNAGSADTLCSELAAIAYILGVASPDGDTVQSVRQLRDFLNNDPTRRLLVFDNAEDPDLIETVLPRRGGTRVVITSTNRAFTHLADLVIETDVYTFEQAGTYLHEATALPDDPEGERAVAEELGCLPLALTAAATTINPPRARCGPRMTYPAYLNKLRNQPLPRVLRREEGLHPYTKRTDQAIMLSIDTAETPTGDPELDAEVRWLLGLFAVLAPSGVSRDLLSQPDPDLDELLDDAVDRCVRYSLLSWSTDFTTLLAHRLTARVLRERARDDGAIESIVTDALDLLESRMFDESHAWARKEEGTRLVDHIDAIIDATSPTTAASETQDRILGVCRWATRQLIRTADLARGTALADRTFELHQRHRGLDDPDTLLSRNNLAYAYELAGHLEKAIPLYEQNVTGYARILGPNHPASMTARHNLAGAYHTAERLDEAIALHQQNASDRERIYGADHPETLSTRNSLGGAFTAAGRLEEAITLFEQSLAAGEQLLGTEHPDVLTMRNNLALAHLEADRPDKAIPVLEKVLTDQERGAGPDHPETLATRNNLATAYQAAGRLDEAIPLLEKVLADQERGAGTDHPNTIATRSNIALACFETKRRDEAIPMLEKVLDDYERLFSTDHPDILAARDRLARAYLLVGRLQEAIPLLEQTLADRERVLGLDHPDTRQSDRALRYAYRFGGGPRGALWLLEQSLSYCESSLGPDHPETVSTRECVAYLREILDR